MKKSVERDPYIKKNEEERNAKWIAKYEGLKDFQRIPERVPEIPVISKKIFQETIIPNLWRCGALPKSIMLKGKTYKGSSRNAKEATWDGTKFIYYKQTMGLLVKGEILHFEDMPETDSFVPLSMKI